MDDKEYGEYFGRNMGILTRQDQEKLRKSKIAIAGIGGVGGIQLAILARAGIGGFSIADPEVYSKSDINRQYGAATSTLGKKKADVMEEILKDINPFVNVKRFYGVNKQNMDDFLEDIDLAIDSIEYFALDEKILLYRKARDKDVTVLTSPIVGFGSSLFVFSPNGMTFEEFFEIPSSKRLREKYTLPYNKICPIRPDYLNPDPYLSAIDGKTHIPSLGISTALSASLVAANSLFLLLNKRTPPTVPKCVHVDIFRGTYDVIDFKDGRL